MRAFGPRRRTAATIFSSAWTVPSPRRDRRCAVAPIRPRPAVEGGHHFTRTQGLKSQLRLQTVCLKRIDRLLFLILLHTN